MHAILKVLCCVLSISAATGRVLSIVDFGARPNDISAIDINTLAFNKAIANATSGDTVLTPKGGNFYVNGGIVATNKVNMTLLFEGNVTASGKIEGWPNDTSRYLPMFEFDSCTNITITGVDATINGKGKIWWNNFILGKLHHQRPKMMEFVTSSDIIVESLHFLDSPNWHLIFNKCERVVARFLSIFVSRSDAAQGFSSFQEWAHSTQHGKLQLVERKVASDLMHKFSDLADFHPTLQPEDLNTDGIDPSGRDIHIHDCSIVNDDDSIAVKPCNSADPVPCSENMLIENMVMTGFGASIGSVPPNEALACVRNITFRNISMPHTGKGVYIKSNPECVGDSKHSLIENILYEDVTIIKPQWWAIWIGPQQQHEPNSKLGRKCALTYPINSHCPTQGCATFKNITLRNVFIDQPLLSPGVILGNATNPMQDIVFDNVTVNKPAKFPFHGYKCENVQGKSINTDPKPCF